MRLRNRDAMKQAFLRFERRLNAISLFGACAMLVIAAALGLFQVITRFILEEPAEWTEVLVRFALIWMVFLGIASAFRHGSMVCVDLLHRTLSPHRQRWLDGLIAAASLVLLVAIVWFGSDYAWRARVQTIIGLESLSMTWAYLALPVGGVFAIFGVIANLLDPERQELETAQ